MSELHEAIARAITELPGADVSWRPDWDEAAAAAVGVVRERITSLRTPDPNLTGEGYADWVGYERALTDMLALFD